MSAVTLRTMMGNYPITKALKSGDLVTPDLEFDFADVKTPNTAFKRVVRDLEFDVAELAIVTFLMAKAYGKPLSLLPAVMTGRFQHPFLVYNTARGALAPSELNGCRIGIRSYTVTTVAWIKGILAGDYGVDLNSIKWTTFEDAHVSEFHDPPEVQRAADGQNLLGMLHAGEIDAAVITTPIEDPNIKTVIPDPNAAALTWQETNKAIQINHMVVVKNELLQSNPTAVSEVYRLLEKSKHVAGLPKAGERDMNPFGLESNRRNLEIVIETVHRQGLIPHRFSVDDLFNDVTRGL